MTDDDTDVITQSKEPPKSKKQKHSHKRFIREFLIENISHIKFVLNVRRRIIFASNESQKAIEILTGQSFDIVKKLNYSKLIRKYACDTYKQTNEYWDNAFKGISTDSKHIKTPNGTIYELSWHPIYRNEVLIAAYVIGHDVTESEKIKNDLIEAKKCAEENVQHKDEYLSRISHELRTPLNSIRGFAQLIDMNMRYDRPINKKHVRNIVKGSDHLLKLIDEVLEIASLSSGQMKLSLEIVSMKKIVNDALIIMQPLTIQNNISIKLDKESIDYRVKADSHRLQQVIINVISNAIKYNKVNGTIRIWGTIEVVKDAVANNVVVEGLNNLNTSNIINNTTENTNISHFNLHIADTGIGISPQMMSRLFIPFDRLGAEMSEIQGTGLGLSLSQKLMQKMNGDLFIQSVHNSGTEVTVQCILTEMALIDVKTIVSTIDENRRNSSTCEDGKQLKILYIEDNLENYQLMEAIVVEHLRAELISAALGERGIELAIATIPDLILLDLGLPDISGKDVLVRLKNTSVTSSIPIIVHSADANPSRIKKIKDLGAEEYLVKPVDISTLISTILKIVN